MAEEHDNVETAPEDESVVALDGQVEQPGAEVQDEPAEAETEDAADEREDEPARLGAFEPNDPSMLLGEMRDHIVAAVKRTPVHESTRVNRTASAPRITAAIRAGLGLAGVAA